MERPFREELRVLTDKLAAMGALVESRVRDGLAALLEHRADLAVLVASGDSAVNDLELEVDDMCLRLLALQGPVASDLRRIRSIIKANTDLERVGDQAVNIAQVVIGLLERPPLRPTFDIARLGEVAIGMLHDSLLAFTGNDAALARAVLGRDDEADAIRDSVFRVLLTHMMADPGTVERALGLILISRSLERVADHATNIAEDLIFLVEGRNVRHRPEDRLTTG
jgi:phosphate transport system protein